MLTIAREAEFLHQHDGMQSLIQEIAAGKQAYSTTVHRNADVASATGTPNASDRLKALIFAIRDAEILFLSSIPADAIFSWDTIED